MIGIRVATLLHILWGIYLVFWGKVPQPTFGGFEPYLVLVPPFILGLIFLFIGLLAFVKNFISNPWWLRPVMIVPQQVVLVWGLLGSSYLLFFKESVEADRIILAMCYGVSITVFHTIDMFHLWHDCLMQREIENGAAGTS